MSGTKVRGKEQIEIKIRKRLYIPDSNNHSRKSNNDSTAIGAFSES